MGRISCNGIPGKEELVEEKGVKGRILDVECCWDVEAGGTITEDVETEAGGTITEDVEDEVVDGREGSELVLDARIVV